MDAHRCPQHSHRRHPLHEHRHTLPPSLTLEMSLSHPRPVSLSLPFEKFDPLAAWPMMASTPVTARWARRVRCGGQAARAAGPARGPGWGRVRSGGAGRELEAGGWGLDQSPAAAAERERERVHGGGGGGQVAAATRVVLQVIRRAPPPTRAPAAPVRVLDPDGLAISHPHEGR